MLSPSSLGPPEAFIAIVLCAASFSAVGSEGGVGSTCCAAEIFAAHPIDDAIQEHFGGSIEVRTIKSEGCRLFVAAGNPGGEGSVAWLEMLADGELDAFSRPEDTTSTLSFADKRTPPASGFSGKRCCGADRYSDEEFRLRVAKELSLATIGERLVVHRDQCRLSAVLWPPAGSPPDSHLVIEVSPTGELRFSGAP